MDVDLGRLPTGDRGWIALIDYAAGLGDLSEVGWLELKGALPFGSQPERKRSAVALARAVLGLSNRMPDIADRHLQGFGVVIVGVQGHDVDAVEEVDGAVLRNALETYLGTDGPVWDHRYVRHDAGLVLIIVVDPPKWGDPIQTFRKDFTTGERGDRSAVREGEIFVRHPAMIRPATTNDIRALERRTARSRVDAAIAVHVAGDAHCVVDGSPRAFIERAIDRAAHELLDSLPAERQPNAIATRFAAAAMVSPDGRTQARFRREVEAWREDATSSLSEVARDVLRHEWAHALLRAANVSEAHTYLESVRIQLQFPEHVTLIRRDDTDHHDDGIPYDLFRSLPDRPPPWGKGNALALRGLASFEHGLAPREYPSALEVRDSETGPLLIWHLGDLRPGSTETCPEAFAVITEMVVDEVVASWSATARGIDHVFRGEIALEPATENSARRHWVFRDDPQ